ncbi:hypothetical protein [Mameliella alba]|uniref:Uncharacterized protein n=1 Tax=Mameliella alba TaxID=561184 RepID=A0A0B3S111_9RHOB|nr:hypothetical protein [Mameliella alba]KHQ50306.1 hypothetical protein OA50_05154 [Mameliella alba]
MSETFTPLEVAERIIGGIPVLAVICGLDAKAPYHWRRAAQGRAAGYIPINRAGQLWRYCEARKLPMRPEWLLVGATSDEVEAALAPPVAAE